MAVDLLEIAPIPGVTVVRGDFREETVLQRLEDTLGGRKLDLVVSDMAPNLSGVRATDQARSVHLCELALAFAKDHLKPRGAFLVKVFQGTGYPEFLAAMRAVLHRRCFPKTRGLARRLQGDVSGGKETQGRYWSLSPLGLKMDNMRLWQKRKQVE
jgi:23S rRNA U2552 (ribose-2'-O)-methylase RlmE/FtsJ